MFFFIEDLHKSHFTVDRQSHIRLSGKLFCQNKAKQTNKTQKPPKSNKQKNQKPRKYNKTIPCQNPAKAVASHVANIVPLWNSLSRGPTIYIAPSATVFHPPSRMAH